MPEDKRPRIWFPKSLESQLSASDRLAIAFHMHPDPVIKFTGNASEYLAIVIGDAPMPYAAQRYRLIPERQPENENWDPRGPRVLYLGNVYSCVAYALGLVAKATRYGILEKG